jgi:hypothetical protein
MQCPVKYQYTFISIELGRYKQNSPKGSCVVKLARMMHVFLYYIRMIITLF